MPNNPPKNNAPDKALVERLRDLLTKVDGPNGHDWVFPLRVQRCDGKPTIVSHKGGNLFRGYIGTWDDADLIVETVNALPEILDALASNSPAVGEDERVIPAVMKPWHGGDHAPNDWDGGPIIFRSGNGPSDPSDKGPWYWKHDNSGSDIIAYTPKPTPTDTADRQPYTKAPVEGERGDGVTQDDRREAIARAIYAVKPISITTRKEPLTFDEVAADGCWCEPELSFKRADAVLSLIAVPDGMVLVPREPTEAMLCAWATSDKVKDDWRADCRAGWSAMIAAATGEA